MNLFPNYTLVLVSLDPVPKFPCQPYAFMLGHMCPRMNTQHLRILRRTIAPPRSRKDRIAACCFCCVHSLVRFSESSTISSRNAIWNTFLCTPVHVPLLCSWKGWSTRIRDTNLFPHPRQSLHATLLDSSIRCRVIITSRFFHAFVIWLVNDELPNPSRHSRGRRTWLGRGRLTWGGGYD